MLNEKQFKSAVSSIKKNSEKLAGTIHACGLYALSQSFNGNPNQAKELVTALHKSQRAEALKKWLINFGCLKWDSLQKQMAYSKKKDFSPDKIDTILADADAHPFYAFSKEIAIDGYEFDFMQHLLRNIKVAESLADGKKTGKYTSLKHGEVVTRVKSVLANDAAQQVVAESGNVIAIAEAMAKRTDAMSILQSLADQLGFDVAFTEDQQQKAA